ncbi:MAG: hypothetical protein ACR2IS_08905, partial [Nitrososphaeraceae archaeon]
MTLSWFSLDEVLLHFEIFFVFCNSQDSPEIREAGFFISSALRYFTKLQVIDNSPALEFYIC